jgi:ribosome-binding protein aMBF1 (putative translation factor)
MLLCTSCGIRPRHVTSGGITLKSCRECHREKQRVWSASYMERKLKQQTETSLAVIPDRSLAAPMCIDCGIRPRHSWRNGKPITRCRECYTKYHRDAKRELERKRSQRVTTISQPKPQPEEQTWGLLAQSTMLLDQSRSALTSGQVQQFAIQLTVDGVQMTLAAKRAATSDE